MTPTQWLNAAQDQGLVSDNCITIEEVHPADFAVAVSVIGRPELDAQDRVNSQKA